MNAILRENDEAPVPTLETIDAHLSHMRPDLEAVKAALPVLRDKIDNLSSKVDSKIDQANRDRAAGDAMLAEKIDQKFEQANKERAAGDAALAEKIDQLSAKTDARFDQANRERAAGDAALAEKIDQLSAKTDARFDQANKERAAGDAALGEKIDKLSAKVDTKFDSLMERVLEMQGQQKGFKWFIASLALIIAGATLAHDMGWI